MPWEDISQGRQEDGTGKAEKPFQAQGPRGAKAGRWEAGWRVSEKGLVRLDWGAGRQEDPTRRPACSPCVTSSIFPRPWDR